MVPGIRKVGPRVTRSQMRRVSMTTLWVSTTGTVRLLEQWKQRYLPNTYHAKREGRTGNKLSELSRSESKRGMNWHPKPSCKPRSDPCVKPPATPHQHTCQPPEYKNLETNPKIFKVGAIFVRERFFSDFTFFNAITVHYLWNKWIRNVKRATVGSSREIWCSNRETGRFHEKLGDSRENRDSWLVCGVYTLVVLYQKSHSFASLTRSISDTPQLVYKHRTQALSMKYSIFIPYIFQFLKMWLNNPKESFL